MSERKRAAKKADDKAKADRLAAALRANLKRRKAQARAKGGPADTASGKKKFLERPVNGA
jgi:hypothetical protein